MLFQTNNKHETQSRKVHLEGADLRYYPQFLSEVEADLHFTNLQTELAWKSFPIKMFGKMVEQPRLVAWHGLPEVAIKYSGVKIAPSPFTPTLLLIKQKIEAELGLAFNGVLCNLYRNEKDSMGWHADDEKYLGQNPVIPSLSLGAVRTFQLKSKTTASVKANLLLEHGSLLIMQGETQANFKHQLPKTSKPCAPRINLTFRQIIPHLV